jgi:hypothetical protein
MSQSRIRSFLPVLALVFLTSAPVHAQQHRATRPGNPATRFAPPLRTPDDLRALLNPEKLRADVNVIAKQSGPQGDLDDLRRVTNQGPLTNVKAVCSLVDRQTLVSGTGTYQFSLNLGTDQRLPITKPEFRNPNPRSPNEGRNPKTENDFRRA